MKNVLPLHLDVLPQRIKDAEIILALAAIVQKQEVRSKNWKLYIIHSNKQTNQPTNLKSKISLLKSKIPPNPSLPIFTIHK